MLSRSCSLTLLRSPAAVSVCLPCAEPPYTLCENTADVMVFGNGPAHSSGLPWRSPFSGGVYTNQVIYTSVPCPWHTDEDVRESDVSSGVSCRFLVTRTAVLFQEPTHRKSKFFKKEYDLDWCAHARVSARK
jgi:hypothetical protein